MVSGEERGRLVFVDQGYDSKEAVVEQPRVMRSEGE